MRNTKNEGSFVTAKLPVKRRSLLAIIAIVAIIGFSFAACNNGDDDDEVAVVGGVQEVSLLGISNPNVTEKLIVGGVMLSWSPVIGASGYEVWRNGGGQLAAQKLAEHNSLSPNYNGMYEYFDIVNFTNELKPNTQYTYTVIAIPLTGVKDIGKWEKAITTNAFPDQGSKAAKPTDVNMSINLKNKSIAITVTPPATGNIPNAYNIKLIKDTVSTNSLDLSFFNDPSVPFNLTLYGDEKGNSIARWVYQALDVPGNTYTARVTASLGNNTYFKVADESIVTRSPMASSVDDYSELEPVMDPNSNRAVARTGGTTVISIPDSLRGATGTVSFAVNPVDASVVRIVSQDGSSCTVEGLTLGSARINVTVGSQTATVVVAVSPSDSSYTLLASAAKRLGDYNTWDNGISNRPDTLPSDYANYIAEPTTQLAYCFKNNGIDFLAYYVDPTNSSNRGWVRTTFTFGGWRYDLNGVNGQMSNGVQTSGNVKLELKPEFVYDNGIPYLQIIHTLTNTGSTRVTGQKFGASADIMIFGNDRAPLTYLDYGALMTDKAVSPSIKFRFVCQNVQGVDNVSTLWLGTYGSERSHVYDDSRVNITNADSAMNFSYQNIDLNPGESKTFVVRFTQIQ